eukprot:TRINITY_DN67265_c5_g1_i2.p1 TRINITY_DN67265_c5_g1~~TRINITY_DN67265_c5_g1_i2.p1  ORF type:complete len:226 (+),score=49.76 TRINITY_DN67265_c5_g1_i2:84-761(+)
MSLLKRLLSKPTTQEPASHVTNSRENLNGTLDTMDKREAVLNKRIEQEVLQAKDASSKGNKTKALMHLKRRKAYEQQLANLQSQKGNLFTLQIKLDEATLAQEVMDVQTRTARDLKKLYGKLTPEAVDDQMALVKEVIEDANQVTDAISQPIDDFDPDEYEDELAELEKEMQATESAANKAPQRTGGPLADDSLVTTSSKTDSTSQMEEDLAELDAELNAPRVAM